MFLDTAAAKDTSVVQRGRRARSRAGGSERIPRGSVQLTRRQPARRPLAITGHGDRRGTYCRIQVIHHQNVTEIHHHVSERLVGLELLLEISGNINISK